MNTSASICGPVVCRARTAATTFPFVVDADYVCRIKTVEFVDLFAVFDVDVPSQTFTEHACSQLEHFVENVAEHMSVHTINYDDHFFPLRVVVW